MRPCAGFRYVWLFAALLSALFITGCPESRSSPEPDFLRTSWQAYKRVFITQEGYVWDALRNEVTSEGQSYALLRAAWMNDSECFAKVLAWTEDTLRRPDGLYSWRWRPDKETSSHGRILDANTATDADQDIAFALLIASWAFDNAEYLERARQLVRAIRQHTGIALPGGWLPSAGNWAVDERIINISYFAPYAYPYFARLDPDGNWDQVRSASYAVLSRIPAISPSGLPPNFAIIDAHGTLSPVEGKAGLDSDFSYDAVRTYWRVALDCRLLSNPRACADPARTEAIARLIARDGRLYARYSLDGKRKSDVESLSFYGATLPALEQFHPALAQAIRKKQLAPQRLAPILTDNKRYYDLNWIWFGFAAVDGLINEKTPGLHSFP